MAFRMTKVTLRLLLLMSILRGTGLSETPPHINPCQEGGYKGTFSNLPCIRNETFFNATGSATRQIDICMGLPQLMQILENSQNMQIKNRGLTIAKGEVIVDDDQAARFREKWIIAISVEVDQEHGVLELFLRYSVAVRNPDYSDEYCFRLVFIIDGLSFSTESKIWFPTSDQQNAQPSSINPVLADPTTEPARRPTPAITTPITPLEPECVSPLEFHEAINHTNDMIAELKQSSWCDWKCALGIAANIALLAVSLVWLLLKFPQMITACKNVYQKIISACSKLTAIPQDDTDGASLDQVTTSGSQKGSQQGIALQDMDPSTSSRDQNLPVTAEIQDSKFGQRKDIIVP